MNLSRRLIGPSLGARILSRNIHRSNIHRMAAAEASGSTRKSGEPDTLPQLRKALEDSARPKDNLASVARELQEQLKLRNEQKNELQDQKTSPELASLVDLLSYLDPRPYFLAMNPLSALFNNDPHSFVLLDEVKKTALHVRRGTFISLAAKAALYNEKEYCVYIMKGKHVEPQFLHPKADILYFLERKFLYNRLLCRMHKRMKTIPPGQLMDNLEKKSRQLESPAAPPLRKLAKMPMHQVVRFCGKMEVPRHLFVLVKSGVIVND